jgi:hypothetical protein
MPTPAPTEPVLARPGEAPWDAAERCATAVPLDARGTGATLGDTGRDVARAAVPAYLNARAMEGA